jgi:hypothetical protein
MEPPESNLDPPATNEASWARMVEFMSRFAGIEAFAGGGRNALAILRCGQALHLDQFFRAGQSMQHLIFSTASRHGLTDEPRVTVAWPEEDTESAATGAVIEVSLGRANRWFSAPDRAAVVAGSDGWPVVAQYMGLLWQATRGSASPPAGLFVRPGHDGV